MQETTVLNLYLHWVLFIESFWHMYSLVQFRWVRYVSLYQLFLLGKVLNVIILTEWNWLGQSNSQDNQDFVSREKKKKKRREMQIICMCSYSLIVFHLCLFWKAFLDFLLYLE